jgi:uncharacterized protein
MSSVFKSSRGDGLLILNPSDTFGLACFALIFCVTPSLADPAVEHQWVGEFQMGDVKHFVELSFEGENKALTGVIAYPASGVKDMTLSAISTDGRHVTFAWTESKEPVRFEGSLSDGQLAGDVHGGNQSGTLQLVPVTRLTKDAEDRLLGYYDLGSGHLLSVTSWPLGLVYVDYTSGRAGVVFPSSENTSFAGPAFQVPVPIKIHGRLTTDPQAKMTALHWQDGDSGQQQVGTKLNLRREEVVFKNGDVTLSGTLVLPSGKEPHPAIVRIHGSGPQTKRNNVDGWYAYNGIAYLSFDKRGAGKSTGDWKEAGIAELGEDVLAAVRFLRQRSDIDGSQIGIEGDSEGGWIAPYDATHDPKIAFIILRAGPAMDYVPELMNEVEEGTKARGLDGEELKKALTFKQQTLTMLQDGAGLTDEGWAKFQAFVAPYRSEKWFPYVREPEQRGWPQKRFYLMTRVKSSELWRHVTTPVLALYGGKDLNVPAARNVSALNQELTEAGNKDFTVKLFPNANHDGLETDNAVSSDEEVRYLRDMSTGISVPNSTGC